MATKSLDATGRNRHRILSGAFALTAIIFSMVALTDRATAAPPQINILMRQTDPRTYNQATGAGATWANSDVAAPHPYPANRYPWNLFHCGAVVAHLVKIDVPNTGGADAVARTVAIDLQFNSWSDGVGPGAGHTEFVGSPIVLHNDPATSGDKASSASLSNIAAGTPFVPNSFLTATLSVTDVELLESIVVQVNTRLTCDPKPYNPQTNDTPPRSGRIYSRFFNARETSPAPQSLGANSTGLNVGEIYQVNNSEGAVPFTVTKAAPGLNLNRAQPGTPVTFSIGITNTGTKNLHVESVTDSVFGVVTLTGSGCDDVAAGTTKTCTFTRNVTGVIGSFHRDTVTIVGGGNLVNSNELAIEIIGNPKIEIVKEWVADTTQGWVDVNKSNTVDAGDQVVFRIKVTNTGDVNLSAVQVTDSIPGVVPTCPGIASGLAKNGGTLTCAAVVTLTSAQVTAGKLSNTATVDTDLTDPKSNTGCVTFGSGAPDAACGRIKSALDITIKINETGPFKVGQNITVTVTVSNTGSYAISNAVVTQTALALNNTIAVLAVGDTRTYNDLPYTVTAADLTATKVAFTAEVKAGALAGTASDDELVAAALALPSPLTTVTTSIARPAPRVTTATRTLPITGAGDSSPLWWAAALASAGVALVAGSRARRRS